MGTHTPRPHADRSIAPGCICLFKHVPFPTNELAKTGDPPTDVNAPLRSAEAAA